MPSRDRNLNLNRRAIIQNGPLISDEEDYGTFCPASALVQQGQEHKPGIISPYTNLVVGGGRHKTTVGKIVSSLDALSYVMQFLCICMDRLWSSTCTVSRIFLLWCISGHV